MSTLTDKIINIDNESLTTDQKIQLDKLINQEFAGVFAKTTKPSRVANVAHSIDTSDAKPVHRAPYRTSPKERDTIRIQKYLVT